MPCLTRALGPMGQTGGCPSRARGATPAPWPTTVGQKKTAEVHKMVNKLVYVHVHHSNDIQGLYRQQALRTAEKNRCARAHAARGLVALL